MGHAVVDEDEGRSAHSRFGPPRVPRHVALKSVVGERLDAATGGLGIVDDQNMSALVDACDEFRPAHWKGSDTR
jgi:hypothetical protein